MDPKFAPLWEIDCGPFFSLVMQPKPEAASIDNPYQEAEKIIRKAAAAEDLYIALERYLHLPADPSDMQQSEAGQQACAALLKANPQRT